MTGERLLVMPAAAAAPEFGHFQQLTGRCVAARESAPLSR